MEENDKEPVAQENDTETTENKEEEVAVEETSEPEESVDELKKKLATSEAQKDHWRKKAQTPQPVKEAEEKPELSTKDVLFLAKADIHEDDYDEVLERAAYKKISVSEAYKQLKPFLEVKAEQRKSAETANVSNVRRGTTKVSDDVLLENARAGKLPDSDDEIERVIKAASKRVE